MHVCNQIWRDTILGQPLYIVWNAQGTCNPRVCMSCTGGWSIVASAVQARPRKLQDASKQGLVCRIMRKTVPEVQATSIIFFHVENLLNTRRLYYFSNPAPTPISIGLHKHPLNSLWSVSAVRCPGKLTLCLLHSSAHKKRTKQRKICKQGGWTGMHRVNSKKWAKAGLAAIVLLPTWLPPVVVPVLPWQMAAMFTQICCYKRSSSEVEQINIQGKGTPHINVERVPD